MLFRVSNVQQSVKCNVMPLNLDWCRNIISIMEKFLYIGKLTAWCACIQQLFTLYNSFPAPRHILKQIIICIVGECLQSLGVTLYSQSNQLTFSQFRVSRKRNYIATSKFCVPPRHYLFIMLGTSYQYQDSWFNIFLVYIISQ